jgi:predicted transcriptional regulator
MTLLREGPPLSIDQICAKLRITKGTAYVRLCEMMDVDEIHRTWVNSPTGGRVMLYAVGPGEKIAGAQSKKEHAEFEDCRRTVRKTYPAIGRRDPLVAALFGEIKQAA